MYWRDLLLLFLRSVVPFPMNPRAPGGPPFLAAGEGRVSDWTKTYESWKIRFDFNRQSSDAFPVKNKKEACLRIVCQEVSPRFVRSFLQTFLFMSTLRVF